MIFAQFGAKKSDLGGCWLKICRYYAINYPFYKMDPHTHAEWEIMYVVHGRCQVGCMEKDEERNYDLKEGEYILLGGGVGHRLTVEKDMPCRILNLEGRLVRSEFPRSLKPFTADENLEMLFNDRDRVMLGNDDGMLHETMNALIRELKENAGKTENRQDLLTDLLLGQFLILLARQRALGKKNRRGGSVYIRRAQEYLEENFDRKITVASVACAVGISEGYLQRLYRKETGSSVMDGILRLRIEKAKLLLETSSLPVIDVAVNVGFNSRQHFSAMFTQLAGCSPASYRKNKGNLRVAEGFS